MAEEGLWWFYRVQEKNFDAIKKAFEKASIGKNYDDEMWAQNTSEEGLLDFGGLLEVAYHIPFHDMAYSFLEEEESLLSYPNDLIELVGQFRSLPPVSLCLGVGKDRFSQIPGFFGNMLIHPSNIEEALISVSNLVEITWEIYLKRSVVTFDYSTGDGLKEAKDASEILHALPNALQSAKDSDVGLLALTSWGAP